MEGCYADLAELALAHATHLVFLNPGVEACVANCRARPWEPHKYSSAAAQDRNLPMLVEWVRGYATRDDEYSLRRHRELFDEGSDLRGGERVHAGSRLVIGGLDDPPSVVQERDEIAAVVGNHDRELNLGVRQHLGDALLQFVDSLARFGRDEDGIGHEAPHEQSSVVIEQVALVDRDKFRKLARADLVSALAGFSDAQLAGFVDGWFAPDTQAALQALVARLKK